jgi:predicted Rossmann fold nucleotide-binding protein DprA/Smf involved in DNA uptake
MTDSSFLGFLSPLSLPNPDLGLKAPAPKALSGTAVVYLYLEGKDYLTAQEIEQGTGLPIGTVYAGLSNLCKAGKIEREQIMPKGRRRSLQRFRVKK